MKIHIPSVQTVYINLPEHHEKNESMKSLLESFTNVTRIDGVKHEVTIAGISLAHRNALEVYDKPPILVLEDDCIPYNMVEDIEVPDDADIVFLGIWSYTEGFTYYDDAGKAYPNYEVINKEVSRVYRMISGHAVMFTSDYGLELAKKVYKFASIRELWQDMFLSQTLGYANAYALNKPVFAQTSMHKQTWTEIPLLPLRTIP
jgi:hypothetical protein